MPPTLLIIASCFVSLSVVTASNAQPARHQTVFFEAWSAALDAPARDIISETAKLAVQNPNSRVVVTGFADRIGTMAADRRLSKLRAKAVTDGLVANGVVRRVIDTRTGGAVPSRDVIGRRVEIAIASKR